MNNNFFKSALILSIGGCLTKIISLVIKILITRIIGIDGMSLIAIINPTYSLLIALASFNIMVATSLRIQRLKNTRKVMVNSLYIMFFLNTFLIIFMLLFGKLICVNLLHSSDAYYPLMAATLSLPFISLGYIVKGYFYGKENITPHMISNVLEQLFRLLIIFIFLPKVLKYGKVITVSVFLLFNVFTESFSIIILYLFLPKNKHISVRDFKYDKIETHEILSISIPTIIGRLLGNIGYFFEPVLLNLALLSNGVSENYILREYGIYNTYVISTLLFPSFIVSAISNSLLPEINKYYIKNDKGMIRKRIKEAFSISLAIGIFTSLLLWFFGDKILYILYNTDAGFSYMKILLPFFILYYLESQCFTVLSAINKVKTSTLISTSGIVIKLIVLVILGFMGFKIYALIFSEIVNILYVSLLSLWVIKKYVIS